MQKASMEEVLWQDVRADIEPHNKVLVDIIDEINPGSKYTLYKVRYPFGSEILKDGLLQLPNSKGQLVVYNHPDIKKSVQDDLSYNYGSNPVSLVLKNTTELFTKFGNREIPIFDLLKPGQIFGLWKVLNSDKYSMPTFDKLVANSSLWGMTSGARFLFMLPKISKAIAHHRLLQKMNVQTSVPNDILDHWFVFKEIEQRLNSENPWFLEILYFSSNWFKSIASIKWLKLHNYLLTTAWRGTDFWRSEFIRNMIFAKIQEKRNIRPDPYITNTVEHLFAIGIGALPAFAPAIDDSAGPISKIQKIYNDVYKLDYDPIILQPLSFSLDPKISRPVYYSLQFPTTIELSPKARVLASKITDLIQIQNVLKKFQDEILAGTLSLESTELYHLINKVNYDFFHTDIAHYENIMESKEIPILDENFINTTSKLRFPENSPFVRGCVKISLSKK